MTNWQLVLAGFEEFWISQQQLTWPSSTCFCRDHEIQALWEWLDSTGRKLEVIGMKGPLPPQNDIEQIIAMKINPPQDLGWHHQSVAFIVL
ncbi:TPA: hypothetical protein ACH3X1_002833 [Trebouxia sp. C0004]